MITSKKGQEMFRGISPIYGKSEIEQAIYEAIGAEFDDADQLADDILLQLFPQTATWGLSFWEKRVSIITNLNESIDKRRKKVITKMQTKWPLTPERMANILKNYTNADITITEGVAESTFQVLLSTTGEIGEPFEEIIDKIKKIKPSHMASKIAIKYITKIYMSISSSSWRSEALNYCGTVDNSGITFISTDGKRLKELITDKVNKYFSEAFAHTGESIYPDGSSGRKYAEYITDTKKSYFSISILQCSADIYCGGGVYS